MRLIVINPNTSASFCADMRRQLAPLAAPGSRVEVMSPVVGLPSVESHRDEAIAAVGLCEIVSREEQRGADGYLIACFGDTGLAAAREIARGPVVGMTEAALQAAAMLADRFAIVTLPRRTMPHSARVVAHLGLGHRCLLRAIDMPVGALEEDSTAVYPALLAEARRAAQQDGAEALILGCAGLADLAAPLSQELGMPVIDGVSIGLKMLEGLVACGLGTSKVAGFATPPDPGQPVPHLAMGPTPATAEALT